LRGSSLPIATPVIVVTGMSITPHSPGYKDFLANTGWRDPHRVAGWAPRWPSFLGGLGTALDHIFISNEIRLQEYSVGTAAGSDHQSLEATVSLGPG